MSDQDEIASGFACRDYRALDLGQYGTVAPPDARMRGMMVPVPAGLDGNPHPISTPQRDAVISRVAHEVSELKEVGRPLLVGVDGIDGSGKSTFADELAARLADTRTPVVRSTVDSFHHPREIRWSRGKSSPVGFYLDSHDLSALRELLLDPLRAGTGATHRIAAFDEPTDQPVDEPARAVSGGEVLIFDGIGVLQPAELREHTRLRLNHLGFPKVPPHLPALWDQSDGFALRPSRVECQGVV